MVSNKRAIKVFVIALFFLFCLANFTPYVKDSCMSLPKEKIKFFFQGKVMKFDLPIIFKSNCYYIPLLESANYVASNINIKDNLIDVTVKKQSKIINTESSCAILKDMTYKFINPLRWVNNKCYISLFDFTKVFNLVTSWDINKNDIFLFENRQRNDNNSNIINQLLQKSNSKKIALLRLEDVTAGSTYKYGTGEALEKLRIISDYLYSERIPFHVAWVPRYVDPRYKIDNDLATVQNMYNADFLFTLYYMMDRNGVIGLHGYTHQYGNTVSVSGCEFHTGFGKGKIIPPSKQYAEYRIQSAIKDAKALNILCPFFEMPHYAAQTGQLEVAQKYFNFLYEPFTTDGITEAKTVVRKQIGKRVVEYIPTPLNYLDGKKDLSNMIYKINHLKRSELASFFYHPYIEFDDIKLTRDAERYPLYTYSNYSPLKSIVSELKKNGYNFQSIYTSLKGY